MKNNMDALKLTEEKEEDLTSVNKLFESLSDNDKKENMEIFAIVAKMEMAEAEEEVVPNSPNFASALL